MSPLCCLAPLCLSHWGSFTSLLFIRLIGITGVPSWSHSESHGLERVRVWDWRGLTVTEKGRKENVNEQNAGFLLSHAKPETLLSWLASRPPKKVDQAHFTEWSADFIKETRTFRIWSISEINKKIRSPPKTLCLEKWFILLQGASSLLVRPLYCTTCVKITHLIPDQTEPLQISDIQMLQDN